LHLVADVDVMALPPASVVTTPTTAPLATILAEDVTLPVTVSL